MTLKRSFLADLRENRKRRGWVFAIIAISLFFIMPVMAATGLTSLNYAAEYGKTGHSKLLTGALQNSLMPTYFIWIWIMILAVLCGMQGFSYLYKKEKIDFYHSMPVSSARRFFIIYGNGILMFLIAYVPAMILTFLLGAVYHVMSVPILFWGLIGLLFAFLIYFVTYSLSVLCAVLAGNLFASGCFFLIFLSYEWLLRLLSGALMKHFQSYASNSMYRYSSLSWGELGISPMLLLANLNGEFAGIDQVNGKTAAGILWPGGLAVLLWGLVFAALALLLYQVRPSEHSGCALAFSLVKLPMEFILLIPAGLLAGQLFFDMSGSKAFYIFGIVSSCILGCLMIEFLCDRELSGFRRHWYMPVICCIISGSIFLSVYLDWFHYDSYLPEKDKVESAAVYLYGYSDAQNTSVDVGTIDNSYENCYANTYMEIMDITPVLELAKAGIREIGKTKEATDTGDRNYAYILYRMKNGKEISRKYWISYDENESLIAALVEDQAYKKGLYEIYNQELLTKFSSPDTVSFYNGMEEPKILKDIDFSELVTTYQKDLDEATARELQSGNITGVIQIEKRNRKLQTEANRSIQEDSAPEKLECYLYAGFKRTASLLAKYGVEDADAFLDASELSFVTISPYEGGWAGRYEFYDESQEQARIPIKMWNIKEGEAYMDGNTLIVSGQDQMREILSHVYPVFLGRLKYDNLSLIDFPLTGSNDESQKPMLVTAYKVKNREWAPYYFSFRPGEMPMFVQEMTEKTD